MHPKRTARRLLPWATVLTVGLLALTTDACPAARTERPEVAPPVTVDKTGA